MCGCIMFSDNVASNILLSFWPTNIVMSIIRLLYAIMMLMSFGVIVYPVRSIFMEWFKLDVNTPKGKLWFYLIGLIIVLFTAALSIAVPDIAVVLNIVSSFFGIPAYWCIPVLAFWILPKLRANSTVSSTDNPEELRKMVLEARGKKIRQDTEAIEEIAGKDDPKTNDIHDEPEQKQD